MKNEQQATFSRAFMNPDLERLHSYPFQKLRALLEGAQPPSGRAPIPLHVGEPRHPTPAFIKQALIEQLDGLANYPQTLGSDALREAIAAWLKRRHRLKAVDAQSQIIPVNGSREALFAFAQAVVDPTRPEPAVVCPNPFYQLYEGSALLAGASPVYLNNLPQNGYACDFGQVPETTWRRVQLVYACSPGNPTGRVMTFEDWKELFALSDRYGFVVASDECYGEIYFDEARPPVGALDAAQQLARDGFPRLIVFSSLSKRSNVPGMRSGFVAGDAAIIKKFLLYRTYHGCTMSPAVQAASTAAWKDEGHVVENRRLYREKFAAAFDILRPVLDVQMPDAAFYFWPKTPLPDPEFALRLHREQGVMVLPGSYLAREARGINPGTDRVRIALVASRAETVEAAQRIRALVETL
jgi:N-succinyldiaminopimelate aminotransferase